MIQVQLQDGTWHDAAIRDKGIYINNTRITKSDIIGVIYY